MSVLALCMLNKHTVKICFELSNLNEQMQELGTKNKVKKLFPADQLHKIYKPFIYCLYILNISRKVNLPIKFETEKHLLFSLLYSFVE